MKCEHYLATLYVGPMHMHSYVMCEERKDVDAVINEMIWLTENMPELQKLRPMGIGCLTILNKSGVKAVRDVITKLDTPDGPEVKKALARATDFHRTTWMMPADDPVSKELMELH